MKTPPVELGRRWPPGEQRGSSLLRGAFTGAKFDDDRKPDRLARGRETPGIVEAIGDLRNLLTALSPAVLGSATYQVGAAGNPVGEQYRLPFRALTVASTSTQYLVLTSDTLKQSAPSSGPGVAIIPPRGFYIANMTGNAWSIYGGLPTDQVTVTAFTRPLPPVMVPGQVQIAGSVFAGSDYPLAAAPVDSDSGVVGAAAATATLPGAAGKTTWITGFEVTGAGATAASVITVTLTAGTTVKHYLIAVPAGATTSITPLIVEFTKPVPATAQNTAITVAVPSFGAGNTSACVTAHGYQL